MYLLGLAGGWLSASVRADQNSEEVFTPEMFGARGDGRTSDGAALDRMISAVNACPGSSVCQIRCTNRYVITGGPRQTRLFNRSSVPGVIEGIPPVTRDNVHVDARGAQFIVPADFPWRRTKKGGDNNDHFAVGWQFLGANCKMTGGQMIGNLNKREIYRGPSPAGFGGTEFGLVMLGERWQLDGVHAENWGTDCLNIGAPGHSRNCTFVGARRNCISVVPRVEFGSGNFVLIEGGSMIGGGQWPEDIRNNPGAGIDIEGPDNDIPGIVRIRRVDFYRNRNKDLQVSTNATNCVVENCTFRSNVKFQTRQKGGHVFSNNRFIGEARVETMYGMSTNAPIVFEGNDFGVSQYPPFRQNVIRKIDQKMQGQRVIFVNNRAPNWKGRFSDIPRFRNGNIFYNNVTKLE